MRGTPHRFKRFTSRVWAVILTTVLGAGMACAQERLPNEPMILKPGEWKALKAEESKLLEKVTLWASFPLERETKEGQSRMRAAKDTPVGIHFLRSFTGDNVTPWQPIVLDDLPLASRKDRKNDALAKATDITDASVLTGTIQQSRSDFYRLKLAKGEAVTIEVLAQRIFSKLDSNLRVLDELGRQLAFCEDEPGLGRDSRLRFTAKAAQTVIIEVRDSFYQGSDQHVYVLRVGDIPRVNAVQVGADKKPVWLGPDADKVGKFMSETGLAQWFAPRATANGPAAMIVAPLDEAHPMMEAEPNGEQSKASALTLPASVFGRFEKGGDLDWYSWDVKKGEKFLIRAQTRSLGFPTDVKLSVYAADGKGVAGSKVATEDEGVLDVTAPADGKLALKVSEIAGLGGPEYGYRINIEAAKTGFIAKTEADKALISPDGVAKLKLTLDRQGYEGEIQFAIAPRIEGLALAQDTIEAKKKEGTLELRADAGLKPGALYQVRLQALKPGTGFVQSYETLTNQWGTSSTMAPVLDGWITVAVKEKSESKEKPKSP